MANRFLVIGAATVTVDLTNTAVWSATSGGATGASVPGTGDAVIVDAASGTGVAQWAAGTYGYQSFTANLAAGGIHLDFATNSPNLGDITINLNLAATTLASTGTGTRTISLGKSVWNITSSALSTIINFGTTTGLTFNPGTAQINILGNNNGRQTINLASLTWPEINLQGTGRGSYNFLGVTPTIAKLTAVGRQDIVGESGRTFTITDLVIDGTDISNMINIAASDSTGIFTIANAAGFTGDYALLRRITFSGAGAKTLNNSIDLGLNTGITINPPTIGGGGGGGGISRARAFGGF